MQPDLSFQLQLKNAAGGLAAMLKFETKVGVTISDLLTEYAAQLIRDLSLAPGVQSSAAAAVPATGGGAEGAPAAAHGAAASPAAPSAAAAATGATGLAAPTATVVAPAGKHKGSAAQQKAAEKAVVSMQAAFRGMKARREFDVMLANLEQELRQQGKI